MPEPRELQQRPDLTAVHALWQQPVFRVDEFHSPAVEELLAELQSTHVNGGALFGRFAYRDHPVLRWFITGNNFDGIDFFEHFLTSDALQIACPDLQVSTPLKPFRWDWSNPYVLAGELAETLMRGGAYEHYSKGGAAALRLCTRVCAELFTERYEDILVVRSASPWSRWFCDVAWDCTWIGVDQHERRIWLLCVTDTD